MNEFGADEFPRRWANFIENLAVKNSNGDQLPVEELPGARWRIRSAREKERVTLTYNVVLNHEDHKWSGGIDGVAFTRDWGVFYTGRTFLIVNGKERNNVAISFQIPNEWHVTASWKTAKNRKNMFVAKDLSDLMDSMFFAGTHDETSVQRDDFELVFALGGEGIAKQKEEYKKLAQGVLNYYIDLMGGPPYPRSSGKFTKSLVIINAGKDLDGEAIGNHISLIFDPNGDSQSKNLAKFLFAHEFFHFWNGKSIKNADTKEEWFKEGITSYYALKALSHIGALTEEDYFKTLGGFFYPRYAADPGYGRSSMRDVAAGSEKHKHWGLIYGGGLFAGICQDISIMRGTSGQKSFDDLLRDLFKDFGGTDKSYTTADLQRYSSALSKKDQTGFFGQYISGIAPVPLTACMSSAGLIAEIKNDRLLISKKRSADKMEEAILNGVLGK
ncbi:MAG: M1 family aminopeptidase [Pyrinomonadaceae bacterium]